MIWRVFTSEERMPFQASVPDDIRVYAIGDIHGRADLLRQMHQMILEDVSRNRASLRNLIIHLGDYVDRGLQSREVIELLMGFSFPGFQSICLKGNHEDLFLRFLEEPGIGPSWFELGGDATVYSYGVRISQGIPPEERFAHIREELRKAVPKLHLEFLSSLQLTYEAGDYFFVHAGIRPGRSLHEQSPDDLIWIRDEFTDSRANHGKIVVHGHSIAYQPEIRENRIGVDTGAYATNSLTCLVLEKDTKRFLSTTRRTDSLPMDMHQNKPEPL